MVGLSKEVVEELLNGCEDLSSTAYITDEQKEILAGLNLEITDEFTENHIPVTTKIPLRIIKKGINGFIEKLARLSRKEVSKSVYKKIGLLEVEPQGDEEPVVILFTASIVGPRYAHLCEFDLQRVIMDEDDEELREDDQDWIDNPKSSFLID